MIKVSVCITTYNVEKYIEQTLNSILSQKTSFKFEILIGDDCSTDNTRKILSAYKAKFPQIITLHFQEKNVGVNRNDYDLLYLAQGEYIAWCDGDDYWIDNYKLEKQVRFLESNPQYSCVHTLWKNFYEKENYFETINFEQYDWEKTAKGKTYIERLLTKQESGCRFSSLLHPKNLVLKELDKDSSILTKVDHLQNDFAILCLLVDKAPTFLMKDVTVVYRNRPESLSITSSQYKRYIYNLKGLNLTTYLLKKYKSSPFIIQNSLHSTTSFILYCIYKNIGNRNDIKEIRKKLNEVHYNYSLGQKLILLSFKFNWMRVFLDKLIK